MISSRTWPRSPLWPETEPLPLVIDPNLPPIANIFNKNVCEVTDGVPSVTPARVLLFVAGLFGIGWAVGLKYSLVHAIRSNDGYGDRVPPFLLLLAMAMKQLPAGTAYAVWTGIGAVGVAVIGLAFLGESRDAWRLLSIALIAAGIAGLRLTAMT